MSGDQLLGRVNSSGLATIIGRCDRGSRHQTILDTHPQLLRLSDPVGQFTTIAGLRLHSPTELAEASSSEGSSDGETSSAVSEFSDEARYLNLPMPKNVQSSNSESIGPVQRVLEASIGQDCGALSSRLNWMPMKFTDYELERRYRRFQDTRFQLVSKYALYVWISVGVGLLLIEIINDMLLNLRITWYFIARKALRVLQIAGLFWILPAPRRRRNAISALGLNLLLEWTHTTLTLSAMGSEHEISLRLAATLQRQRMYDIASQLRLEFLGDAWTEFYALILVNVVFGFNQQTASNFNLIFWILHIKYTVYSLATAPDSVGLALGSLTRDDRGYLHRHASLPGSLLLGRGILLIVMCLAQVFTDTAARSVFLERYEAASDFKYRTEDGDWSRALVQRNLAEDDLGGCITIGILLQIRAIQRLLTMQLRHARPRIMLKSVVHALTLSEHIMLHRALNMHSINIPQLAVDVDRQWAQALVPKIYRIEDRRLQAIPPRAETRSFRPSTLTSALASMRTDSAEQIAAFAVLGQVLDATLGSDYTEHAHRKISVLIRILRMLGALEALALQEKIGLVLAVAASQMYVPEAALDVLYNGVTVADGMRNLLASELIRVSYGRAALQRKFFREVMDAVSDFTYYSANVCSLGIRSRADGYDPRQNAKDARYVAMATARFIQLFNRHEERAFRKHYNHDIAHLIAATKPLMRGGDDHSTEGGQPVVTSGRGDPSRVKKIMQVLIRAETAHDYMKKLTS